MDPDPAWRRPRCHCYGLKRTTSRHGVLELLMQGPSIPCQLRLGSRKFISCQSETIRRALPREHTKRMVYLLMPSGWPLDMELQAAFSGQEVLLHNRLQVPRVALQFGQTVAICKMTTMIFLIASIATLCKVSGGALHATQPEMNPSAAKWTWASDEER